MESITNHYNIVCIANEDYVQHAGVMLCSLFEKNKEKIFRIFFLTNGIGSESQNKLNNLCEKYHSAIQFVTIPDEDLSELPVGQWSTMMYYKLFMPTILPKDVERCLFLDVDMIINDDIEELYQWNLKESVIAACEDITDCIKIKESIGLRQEDTYINSGVMVCNIDAWRKMEEKRPILEFVFSKKNSIVNEQDVIALYFQGRITLLPIRWNMVTFYYLRVPKIFPKYMSELRDAQHHPGIIHFCAPIKPWYRDCTHPYRYLYKNYLAKTVWGNDYLYPYYEVLTRQQRVNKFVKRILSYLGICKYSSDLILMK